MPNILDVARRAGVSAMTVSRVVNGTGPVRGETRRRVLAAMQELKYVPNSLARSLVHQKTHMLAVIIPDITNPFFTTLVRGVEDLARKSGYRVILCNSDEDDDKEREYMEMCLSIRLDGAVIAPAGDQSARNLALLDDYGIPFVLIDREIRGVQADTVIGDSVQTARKLADHLIGLDHRTIALITGSRATSTGRDRIEGYRQALLAADIPFDPALVKTTSWVKEWQEDVVGELLDRSPRLTAILTANNFLAAQTMRALRQRGLDVPADISVVSFDDLHPLSAADPFLTAAVQPAYNFGSLATQLLIERMEGGGRTHAPRRITLQADIAVRRSAGRPRAPEETAGS